MQGKAAAAKRDFHAEQATGLLAYCRPGFEGECAQELTALAGSRDASGFARTERGSGFVEYTYANGEPRDIA